MFYRCVIDCLVQDHEINSLGQYVELCNLRAKAGEVYDETYDLMQMNDNPEGTIFFEPAQPPATKVRISTTMVPEKNMPKPKAKRKKATPARPEPKPRMAVTGIDEE